MRKFKDITDPRYPVFQMKALAALTKMVAPWQLTGDRMNELGLSADFLRLEKELTDFLFKVSDAAPIEKKKKRKRAKAAK